MPKTHAEDQNLKKYEKRHDRNDDGNFWLARAKKLRFLDFLGAENSSLMLRMQSAQTLSLINLRFLYDFTFYRYVPMSKRKC